MGNLRWRMLSPPRPGAVALIALEATSDTELTRAADMLGLRVPANGALMLRDFWGIDRALHSRWSDEQMVLMLHGGHAVVRAICDELNRRGFEEASSSDDAAFPEASSRIETLMLRALCRTPSSLALELLLDQPRRWAVPGATSEPQRDARLRPLLIPAMVVAVGPSNIGKSTLANALAGRGVSLVADEPGTTRDHVGFLLDLAGLVVRYVDTPGVRAEAPALEREAVRQAMELVGQADVVLHCGDGRSSPLDLDGLGVPLKAGAKVLRVALRRDLGVAPFPSDLSVSAKQPESLAQLVRALRQAVVPDEAIGHPGPWRFWEDA